MEDKRACLTIVIVENRQMIATILSDLLAGTGYQTRVVFEVDAVVQVLSECQPGILLVDMGVVRPDQHDQWQRLREQADSCGIPMLRFSCSALPDVDEDVVVLRSPGDFAAVVQRIELEWRKRQPMLGAMLVEQGLVSSEELEAALRVQREMAEVGHSYPLGDLLVRLGMLTAPDLEKVLLVQGT